MTSATKINGEYPCCRALFMANHVCFERYTYVSIDPVMICPCLSELQKLLDEKIKELAKKTQELEDNAPQPENGSYYLAFL